MVKSPWLDFQKTYTDWRRGMEAETEKVSFGTLDARACLVRTRRITVSWFSVKWNSDRAG